METVRNYINAVIMELMKRQENHDQSKLQEPELSIFNEYTPKLKDIPYGSGAYKKNMKEMKVAIDHHNKVNRHHPEWQMFNNNIKEEKWKDVVNFEGYYLISNWGRIKSVEREIIRKKQGRIVVKEKFLKADKTPKGYYRIQLQSKNKTKNMLVHRMVAEAFIPNPENKSQINHKNTIKTDNYIDNLEWVNNSENQIHAYRTGQQKIKYVVHCEELNITTFGTGEMVRKLKKLGYSKALDSTILACINNNSSHHLGLNFTGYVIEEYSLKGPDLISNMTLIDLIEMMCDWKAATLRHGDGDIYKSLEMNATRFGYSEQLHKILKNTIDEIEQMDVQHHGEES